MAVDYDIIVQGNSLKSTGGFLGFSNVTLVHTREGPMLFDVGHLANRDALVNGLARRDLKPADIPRVFLSHLHFDHVGNVDLFPFSTKFYISRSEWDYAAKPHEDDVYVPWMIRERLQQYDLTLIEGSGEFEPGLRYIAAPGHTPGGYVLVLDTADKGCVVLTADSLKGPKEALTGNPDQCYDTPEAGAKTIQHIVTIADRIVPGHFSELIKRDGVLVWEEPGELHLLIR